jgi:hypothetical protein
MHTSSKFAKVPPFSIGQDKITMRHGRTVSGLTFLTKLLFEEKSIKHCYHLKFFAKSSSNTVHSSFVTELVNPVKQDFTQLTFSLKPKNS